MACFSVVTVLEIHALHEKQFLYDIGPIRMNIRSEKLDIQADGNTGNTASTGNWKYYWLLRKEKAPMVAIGNRKYYWPLPKDKKTFLK